MMPLKIKTQPRVVAFAYNPKAEARRLRVSGQPETFFQKKKEQPEASGSQL
jgi:hypothetical protein